jgi:pilus assembly protein Flp/PilA
MDTPEHSEDSSESELEEMIQMRTQTLKSRFYRMLSTDRGATAVEYGLIVALIALAIIVGVTLVGTNLDALFTEVGESVAP